MRTLLYSVTLKDCEIQTFRAGGNGGQNQNKRDTGVRIIHHPSGARGEARDQRSQLQNKKSAFRRMAESKEFKLWVYLRSARNAAVESEVERSLSPQHIRIEVKRNGKWVEA